MKAPFFHWPLTIAALLSAGMLLGATLFGKATGRDEVARNVARIQEVLSYIRHDYVDTVNTDKLGQNAIVGMLERLDPHSTYVPSSETAMANAQLEDNFEGIGIEFVIMHDTIQVINPMAGGPSEKAGVMAGDRLVRIDGQNVAGTHVTNADVFKKLRGPRGSPLDLVFLRPGKLKPVIVSVKRSIIPSKSVDTYFMADATTGYIKISRFTSGTGREFHEALKSLKAQHLERLVLDLRDNPGGYLDKAIEIADEFLPEGRTITYTEGKASKYNATYTATKEGLMEKGSVCILVDEGSASAAEILAGALQDNDRAIVVGRRSFGKGLVQMPIELADGGELRLTISRYHTPSGRCIQKPYQAGGIATYENDLNERYKHGEFFSEDSIHQADTNKYRTISGRVVYGGGGIRPDVFVPLDTLHANAALAHMQGVYVFDMVAQNAVNKDFKASKNKGLPSFRQFYNPSEDMVQSLLNRARREGVGISDMRWAQLKPYAAYELKAAIARRLFGDKGLYYVLLAKDPDYLRALQAFPQTMARR